jgi:hypothetical protein
MLASPWVRSVKTQQPQSYFNHRFVHNAMPSATTYYRRCPSVGTIPTGGGRYVMSLLYTLGYMPLDTS